MRILFSVTYFSPYVSGLTIWVRRMAEQFVREGNTVSIVCMQHDASLSPREKAEGVTVVRAKPLVKVSKGFLSLDWIIQSWREVAVADVVIVNLPQAEGWIPALFGRLMGKRVIAEYHCEVVLPPGLGNSIVQKILELTNMATLFLAHKVSTYTKDYADASRLLTVVRNKVVSIYPPIPKPIINQIIRRRLEKLALLDRNTFVIGVAARLAAEKGIEYLLEAVKKLKIVTRESNISVKLLIAGPRDPVGEEAYKQKIDVLVKDIQEDVVFFGTLSQTEMGAFYSIIDVLVLPSINVTEAFGMVQVEAMMCGVPVIATDLPGVRVPVQMTGMGVVVPMCDSTRIADAIAHLMQSRYVRKSPMRSIKTFDVQSIVTQYKKLFHTFYESA